MTLSELKHIKLFIIQSICSCSHTLKYRLTLIYMIYIYIYIYIWYIYDIYTFWTSSKWSFQWHSCLLLWHYLIYFYDKWIPHQSRKNFASKHPILYIFFRIKVGHCVTTRKYIKNGRDTHVGWSSAKIIVLLSYRRHISPF